MKVQASWRVHDRRKFTATSLLRVVRTFPSIATFRPRAMKLLASPYPVETRIERTETNSSFQPASLSSITPAIGTFYFMRITIGISIKLKTSSFSRISIIFYKSEFPLKETTSKFPFKGALSDDKHSFEP